MFSCKGLILVFRLDKRKQNIQTAILLHKAEESTGSISIPLLHYIIWGKVSAGA